MQSTSKGILALLRDLMAHEPRARNDSPGATALRPESAGHPLPATRTFDLATEAGDSHWYTASGSPLLGERLPALRAELDRSRAASLN